MRRGPFATGPFRRSPARSQSRAVRVLATRDSRSGRDGERHAYKDEKPLAYNPFSTETGISVAGKRFVGSVPIASTNHHRLHGRVPDLGSRLPVQCERRRPGRNRRWRGRCRRTLLRAHLSANDRLPAPGSNPAPARGGSPGLDGLRSYRARATPSGSIPLGRATPNGVSRGLAINIPTGPRSRYSIAWSRADATSR